MFNIFALSCTKGSGGRIENGSAPYATLASAMLLFSRGSKSSKLGLAWSLFASSTVGTGASEAAARERADSISASLGRARFADFLSAVLTAVYAVVLGEEKGVDAARKEIARGGEFAARRILRQLNDTSAVTFDEFASFYSGSGFSFLSWIELLAMPKWVASSSAGLAANNNNSNNNGNPVAGMETAAKL
jgi:hypothetical protein